MTGPAVERVAPVVAAVRAAAATGAARTIEWRVDTLERLRALLRSHEGHLLDALRADLGRPPMEAWTTEVAFTVREIEHTLAHLASWARPRRVGTPLVLRPGRSRVVPEPKGTVCVLAPWNYPVQLLLGPMVAAVAAGNAVVGKPSELAPASSAALGDLIAALAEPGVAVLQGGADVAEALLRERFDHIFYTGGQRVARLVARAAAEHLTPLTLELGGKSPAIVSRHADVDVAARRIAWGKFVNAGQTCIAPDYVLVEAAVRDELVAAIGSHLDRFCDGDARTSKSYGRIVNAAHVQRLQGFLASGRVVHGGLVDPAERFVAPTVLVDVRDDDPVMNDEVFGPILPVVGVASLDEALRTVAARPAPLAVYVFSERAEEVDAVLAGTRSGGACVNATLVHVGVPDLPFGGVGASGFGAYHGRAGFETFSHLRPVHERGTSFDAPLLYPPYSRLRWALVRAALRVPGPRRVSSAMARRLRRRR